MHPDNGHVTGLRQSYMYVLVVYVYTFTPGFFHAMLPSRVLCVYLACNFVISSEETSSKEWPFFLFSTRDESMIVIKNANSIESQLHNAYSTGQKLPPSCQCVKTGESDRDCTQFDCTCICDLTAGITGDMV